MSVTGAAVSSPNVPAWKRLGLKLKRDENDTATSSSKAVGAPNVANDEASARKRLSDSRSDGERGKRRKVQSHVVVDSRDFASESNTASKNVSKPHGDDVASGNILGVSGSVAKTPKHILFDAEESSHCGPHTSEDNPNGSSVSRRKSVTFTPDTKREDGFSASNLFKSWSAQQKAEQDFDQDLEVTTPASPSPSKKERKTPKSKDPANGKGSQASKPPALNPGEVPTYVSYLRQFHDDRENWKFNKNKQTELLKHIFSLVTLPASLTPAITAYISGLGGASARQRLREEATTILSDMVSDPANQSTASENLNTPEGRQAAYAGALQRHLDRMKATGLARSPQMEEQLEEERQKHERGVRAEAILRELLLDELHPEGKTARTGGESGVTDSGAYQPGERGGVKSAEQTSKKSRKSRTEVSDSSSSDDSDSSDSTISSDESEDEQAGEAARDASGGSKTKKSKPIFDKKLLDQKFGKKK